MPSRQGVPIEDNVAPAILVLLATVGAVNIFAIHTRHYMLAGLTYAAIFTVVLVVLFRYAGSAPLRRFFSRTPIWLLLIAVLAIADERHLLGTELSPTPITTSFALREPALLLLHGRDPYAAQLPGGAPVSPGPGWILLLLPITAPNLTGILPMLGLGLTAVVLRRYSPVSAGLFLLLMLLQPLFESQAANGQDLYLISAMFVCLSLLLEQFAADRRALFLLGLFGGLLATSRMPMLPIMCVPALGLLRRERRSGWLFLRTAVGFGLLLNLGFAYWAARSGDRFQPLHVFHRASSGAGLYTKAFTVVLAAGAAYWILRSMRGDARSWMWGTWLAMAALFIPEALKELVLQHYDLRWEGATYVTFTVPLLAALTALHPRFTRMAKSTP